MKTPKRKEFTTQFGGNGIVHVEGYDIVKSKDSCAGCAFDVAGQGFQYSCSFKANDFVIEAFKKMYGVDQYQKLQKKMKKMFGADTVKAPIVKIYPSCNRIDSPFKFPFIYVKKDQNDK